MHVKLRPLVLSTLFLLTSILISTQSRFLASAQQPDPLPFRAINLHAVAEGFFQPLGIVSTGIEADERLFILERGGRIWVLENGNVSSKPVLDLTAKVSLEGERGLLGMVFDPAFNTNRYFYVNYTSSEDGIYGDTVIARFELPEGSNIADPDSEYVILEVAQDEKSHNGGHLAFDSTDNLIIGMGDGGGVGDPLGRAHSKRSLLGKMLRINPHNQGIPPEHGCGRVRNYKIPGDNPRPNGENGWCAEILSSGWRNPWRYSLDPDSGKMWVGDVGQNRYEEINLVPKTTSILRDYGWPCYEGWEFYDSSCKEPADVLPTWPVEVYARAEADGTFLGSSVTGGFVYQGDQFKELQNHYFYADFISGNVWTIDRNDEGFNGRLVLASDMNVSTFGIDNGRELYLADYQMGAIYRVMGNQAAVINVIAPGFVKPNQVGHWGVTVTNVGVETISSVELTGELPLGLVTVEGGERSGNTISLSVENIAPGQTKRAEWQGKTFDSNYTIDNPTYEIVAEELSYIEIDKGVALTFVSNTIETAYLPLVTR